jgi:nicotinamidase-related amidase
MGDWRHICIDMQRIFAEETPWHVSWMDKVKPQIAEVAGTHAERTIFTRFIPPNNAGEMPGAWQDYYRKWWMMTGNHLRPEMIDLVPELKRLCPPAKILDKYTYSPWFDGRLHAALQKEKVSSLVVTGGETDVCVLAAVLGAIDFGYKIIILNDAVCSGADETHDASLKLLGDRFSVQLQLVNTETFLRAGLPEKFE